MKDYKIGDLVLFNTWAWLPQGAKKVKLVGIIKEVFLHNEKIEGYSVSQFNFYDLIPKNWVLRKASSLEELMYEI